jgi:F-type H+-transporting ATPase subunit gamma
MAESLRDIKQRMKSVAQTGEIARAMGAVAASKMRKAQLLALHSRPYSAQAFQLLANLRARIGGELPLLLRKQKDAKKEAVLVITSDKGLAGAYNSNVLKKAYEYVTTGMSGVVEVVVVGKKARDFFRVRGIEPVKEFTGFGDYTTLQEVIPLADFFLKEYASGGWRQVMATYTNFRSTLKQEAALHTLLPIDQTTIREIIEGIIPEQGRFSQPRGNTQHVTRNNAEHTLSAEHGYSNEYTFEPFPQEILQELLPHLFLVALYHIILECNASEHSARMVAMKNATDNAQELVRGLTLRYNRARQAAITKEIAEVVGGTEALQV